MALTERGLTIPEIMLIAGTRVALGVGIGLLISKRLLGFGVVTTIPILRGVLGNRLLSDWQHVGRLDYVPLTAVSGSR